MLTSLNPHDEFFLTLMRLRLRLLNEDVADRFDILPAKSSITFATWIKLLNKLLKNLVAWLRREAIPNILTMNPRPITSSPFFLNQLYISSLCPPSLLFLVLFLSFIFFLSISFFSCFSLLYFVLVSKSANFLI